MLCPAQILNVPIYVTTQNSNRLGVTVPELTNHFPADVRVIDKTAFSMIVPELTSRLLDQLQHGIASRSSNGMQNGGPTPPSGLPSPVSVILVGIETHICVLQTALDLLSLGHSVYVLADGVSSCNGGERGVALARMAKEGAVVTTSESVLFEMVGDAAAPNFKAIAGLVKDTKEPTKEAIEVFCGEGSGKAGSMVGVGMRL